MKLNKLFWTIALTAVSTATATQVLAIDFANNRYPYNNSRDEIIPVFSGCGGYDAPPCR